MRLSDLLCEAFPYPPGSEVPANITDYRDPAQSKGRFYKIDPQYRRAGKSRGWLPAPRTHLVLTKTGGVIVFYYGHHNTIDWKELLDRLHQEIDPQLQGDIFNLTVKGTGYLIQRGRETGGWSGDRNRYSSDLATVAQALQDRGVAGAKTPIWLGNWAANEGEFVGTISTILTRQETTPRLKLYHGTDSFRLAMIMKTGLKPMAFDDRVWNHTSMDKKRPEHREEAVYLTASRPQAEYYAKKAVNVDRARFGPSKRRELRNAASQAQATITSMTAALERFDAMSPEAIASEDAHTAKYHHYPTTIAIKRRTFPDHIARAQQVVERANQMELNFYDTIEPVILQVSLRQSEYDRLMADDDYLRQTQEADPKDWQSSLGHFGQIAFKGTIPPERIKVIAQGKDAKQVSR